MKYIQYLWMCCIGLCLFACAETDELQTTEGKTGFVVSLKEETVGVEARTAPKDLPYPIKTDFTIRILDAKTDEEVKSESCTGDNQLIEVGVGIYDVVAEYGDASAVELDAPYYRGMAEEQWVYADKATSVDLTCKVANSLVSIKYDETKVKFIDVYEEGYYVKVVADGTPVEIREIAKSAYFPANSLFEVYFCAVKKGESEEREIKLDVERTTLNPADHLILTLSPEPDKYDVPLSITKEEVKQESISATIPLEWLPKPKVTATGFDANNTLAFVETEQKQAALNLNLSSALQDMKFKFNFEDAQFATSLQADKEYLLSNAEDKAAIETALGITLPNVGDKLESIDLSNLLAKLQTNAGVPTTNTIEVDVRANNRWSSEDAEANRTYKIVCSKPEFSIDAYPGNIWTKEFTVNALREEQVTSGNFTTLSSNMTYQYSIDGQTGWTTLSDGMRQDQLTPGTTYYIRGLYRGEVAGEVAEVRTYEAINIPNSTLDEGYGTTYPKRDNPLYTFNGGWIDTRNELTCHGDGLNVFYVSKSSTLPVNDNGSTVAHMMVIGWGAGNTCVGNKGGSVIYNISSGLVCVGDYDASSDAISAKEAYIRPSSLTFTYKALPYNGDEYLIEATLLNITDGVETIIGEGKLQSGAAVGNYTTQSLDITYDDSTKELPISHVKVLFKAGTKEDRDHLEDKFRDASFWEGYANAYIIGSQFWLDSFHFNYDK